MCWAERENRTGNVRTLSFDKPGTERGYGGVTRREQRLRRASVGREGERRMQMCGADVRREA